MAIPLKNRSLHPSVMQCYYFMRNQILLQVNQRHGLSCANPSCLKTILANTPIGTSVMGLFKGSSYSEFAVMKDSLAMLIPAVFSAQQAVVVSKGLTVYQILFKIVNL